MSRFNAVVPMLLILFCATGINASIFSAKEAMAWTNTQINEQEKGYVVRSTRVLQNVMVEIRQQINLRKTSLTHTQISIHHEDNDNIIYNDQSRCRVAQYVIIELRDLGYDVKYVTIKKGIKNGRWFGTNYVNTDKCALEISWDR
jgi:hypothetical protein